MGNKNNFEDKLNKIESIILKIASILIMLIMIEPIVYYKLFG
jgi:hypothetical protein